MPGETTPVPAPTYAPVLRILVNRAFRPPAPVPSSPLPGGAITDRLARPTELTDQLVVCEGLTPSAVTTSIVEPDEYWSLALAHRLLVIGPLSDIAEADLSKEERSAIERRLLGSYYQRYHAIPLPGDLLNLLAAHEANTSEDELAAWVEHARNLIMPAATAGEARRRRIRLRAEAIRRCADGRLSEGGASLAELLVDIIALSHSVRLDVEHAVSVAGRHGGSVSRAMKALANDSDTEFERVLPHLLRADLTLDDFPRPVHEQVLELAARRKPEAFESLVDEATPPTDQAIDTRSVSTETPTPQGPEAQASDPRSLYREIVGRLGSRIIGGGDLTSRLALAGVAHVLGVTRQRVLLCGTTGSGKTHAASTLAEVLDCPCLRIDMADVTATGWKGLDIPDVLDALADRSAGGLQGSVLLLDEIDKVRIEAGTEGNSLQAQVQLQASLLALIDGGISTSDRSAGEPLDTSGVLVIGTGAFGGRFVNRAPESDDLVRWGWIPELAARWGERICLRPPTRAEARELLHRSDRSVSHRFAPLAQALGIEIVVTREVLSYVADLWFRSGSDYRSASEWLLAAARARLLGVLEGAEDTKIVLTPDDIDFSLRSLRQHGDSL